MSDNAHEDKRQQGNDSKSTRTARRKSGDAKAKPADKAGKAEQSNKAQRRKEQNRAAQKAFRERREAKVRDVSIHSSLQYSNSSQLEAKVAELEAKSFGTSVENENLRSIVKRLQEENIALKEAQFTFTMPMGGAAHSINGQQTPTPSLNQQQQSSAIDWSQFTSFNKASQMGKPPSPPQSVSNDSLRSVHDNNSPPLQVHRASTGSASESQDGPSPSDPNAVPTLFGNHRNSNSYEMLKRPVVGSSPNDQLSTPSSIGTNKDDVEALFRSLYPNGVPNGSSIDSILAGTAGAMQPPQLAQQQAQSPYTFLSAQPGLTSFADSSSNMMAKLFEPTSYRDPSSADQSMSSGAPGQSSLNTLSGGSTSQSWADMMASNQNDFLSSLSSTANDATEAGPEDDMFMKQLEQLIQSGNAPYNNNSTNNNGGQPFSPTNYLNMSPSPLQSLSNSQTPKSTTESSDNLQSPRSDNMSNEQGQPVCGPSRIVHVVGEDGRVMRPSEVWTRMGLNSVSEPQDLLIDDLCDQFKGKATCKDGKRYMTYSDLVDMQYARDRMGEKPLMAGPASNIAKLPPQQQVKVEEKECQKHDPALCQAKMNERFLQAQAHAA